MVIRVIKIIIIILKKLKKKIAYSALIISTTLLINSTPAVGTTFTLPVRNQARIERVISESSLKVAPTRLEPVANIKIAMPEYPKRGIVPSNLFGQRQKLKNSSTLVSRGGDKSDNLNELSKLGSLVLKSSDLIRQSPEVKKQFINFLVCKNQLVLNQVLPNVVNLIFNSPHSEIFNELAGPAFKLLLDQIPRSVKYITGAFNNMLPGAHAFQQPIIRHRQVEGPPQQHNSALYSKPKKVHVEINAMVNQPAEVGKMKVKSSLVGDKSLLKEVVKTFKDSRNIKQAKGLLEQCRAGNMSPGKGSKPIPGSSMFELRSDYETRVAFRKVNDVIEVGAIFDKHNQDDVLALLRERFPKN